MIASAPGKLFLLGEYAVLNGHPALVAAVDQRVVARFTPHANPEDPLTVAGSLSADPVVVDGLEHSFGRAFAGVAAARELLQQPTLSGALTVDSTALYSADGRKLGYGSSAAVVVAVAAAVMGRVPTADTFVTLRAWHNRAQQSEGSGGDIAASLLGGLVWLHGTRAVKLDVPPPPLAVFVHPQAASTPSLSRAIRAFAAAQPTAFFALQDRIVTAASTGHQALLSGNLHTWVVACATANTAMTALGDAAGVAIATAEHRELVRHIEAEGGACKPSGAGGGDLSLVTAPSRTVLDKLIRRFGLREVAVAAEGVRIQNS